MPKRVALYIRVSTEEQAKSGYSLPEQRRTLDEHTARQGWEAVEEIADEGNSGANPYRPGIRRIRELAEEGAIDAVLAWKRDRLFRSLRDRQDLEEDLSEYGVRLVSLNDTNSRVGDKILDVLSEEEREQIRERSRAGKRGKARRGLMPGGNQVHFGFRFAGEKAERYEVDEGRMALVGRIFRMVGAESRSLTYVKMSFERERIPTPRGARWWMISTIKRIIENDVYLARPYEEVAALVEPEVAGELDPTKLYGVYWFGRSHFQRNYRGTKKFTVTYEDREEWIAIPVPDCGIPPEWVRAARERLASNVRWSPNTSPEVRLRGRIRCACGYSMTNIKSDGRRYYVCSQHRRRGPCPHVRFHRLRETEARVERFVLRLLRNPDELREQVEEQAERERRALTHSDREVRRLRKDLDKLEIKADNFHDQQAEGLLSMERLREKLVALDTERAELAERLAELSDSEERLRELEALPNLIEEYLRELPYLLELEPVVREYETSAPEPTEGDPLSALYTITPERIRFLSEEELAEKRRAVEEKRARRFRELYAMLNLNVVCHKDRSLEVTWGGDCSKWLGHG
jgi:site-specific DNA recombinase